MPLPAAAAALLPLGASLIQNVGDWAFASGQANKQYHANKRLAEFQFEKDMAMLEYQNRYNSPALQMKRLKEAGLNPNLVYGTGTVAGNMSGSAPRLNVPGINLQGVPSPFQPAGMLAQYQDFMGRQATIDNVKAQTDSTREKTKTELVKRVLVAAQGATKEWDLSKNKTLTPYQVEAAKNAAKVSEISVHNAVQKLALMKQDETIKEKQLGLMDQKKSINAAELVFKQFQAQLAKLGVTSSDNPLVRMLAKMLTEMGMDFGDIPGGLIKVAP